MGLSTTTCRPASSARIPIGTWERFGVTTTIISTSPDARSSSTVATTVASGCSAAACACRSGLEVAMAAILSPSTASMYGAWNSRPASP